MSSEKDMIKEFKSGFGKSITISNGYISFDVYYRDVEIYKKNISLNDIPSGSIKTMIDDFLKN